MLHEFLHANRLELTARCRVKVAARSSPAPAPIELESGVPVLIDQLIEMLRIEEPEQPEQTSGPAGVNANMGRSATEHRGQPAAMGFTVDQIVHDCGDLCQALTELAQEQHEPISVGQFLTFDRCLDNAIADAVAKFGRQRDHVFSAEGARTFNDLAHELRSLVSTASVAYAAIKGGHGAITGATGAVLDRSLDGLRDLVDRVLGSLPSGRSPD